MKKIFAYIAIAVSMSACVNEDKYSWEEDFADRTSTDTLSIGIAFNGSSVTVTGDEKGYVSVSGADVTVKSSSNKFLQLVLSGSSNDGSLLIYSWRKLGVVLNNLTLTNPDGPAINNQCGKSFYITSAERTINTLTDGTTYATAPTNAKGDTIDQKATLFSEGQIYFNGTGTLNVNGNAKNGVASDDYVTILSSTINIMVASTGSNGIKANDGMFIKGGNLTIDVSADGARGIKNDARTEISGGTTTINTHGDCKIETIDGITDTTSCAGIKSDSLFTMTAGTLAITSHGDGGKGINCSENIELNGGSMTVKTEGDNKIGKPKAVKSDTGIILRGGKFHAECKKSWACDNGSDSDEPEDHLTIVGTPVSKTIGKRLVEVSF